VSPFRSPPASSGIRSGKHPDFSCAAHGNHSAIVPPKTEDSYWLFLRKGFFLSPAVFLSSDAFFPGSSVRGGRGTGDLFRRRRAEGTFGLDKIKFTFIIYLLNQSIMMTGKVYPRNNPNKNEKAANPGSRNSFAP
jgi:hypothetical protein